MSWEYNVYHVAIVNTVLDIWKTLVLITRKKFITMHDDGC